MIKQNPNANWGCIEHALAMLPVRPGDCPDELVGKAATAWFSAGPKRILTSSGWNKLYGLFIGALMRAGSDVTDAKDAPGSYILQGWHAQGALMGEGATWTN